MLYYCLIRTGRLLSLSGPLPRDAVKFCFEGDESWTTVTEEERERIERMSRAGRKAGGGKKARSPAAKANGRAEGAFGERAAQGGDGVEVGADDEPFFLAS